MLCKLDAREVWEVSQGSKERHTPFPDVVAVSADDDPLTKFIMGSLLQFFFIVSKLTVLFL
jgi:hypothetical protein